MSEHGPRRDAGQILWIGFPGLRAEGAFAERLRQGRAGGAILFARNLATAEGGEHDLDAIAALAGEIKSLAPADEPPPLVCVDQEGGKVQRIRAPLSRWPPMLAFEGAPADRAETLAEEVGAAVGAEIAALGIDVDFAPVFDVHTNPDNPVIGDRAFSRDPERAAARALAFARGLRRAGVLACGKHFPGHGDTHLDSHLALPTIHREREGLEAIELAPFRRAAAAGALVPMIMTAHVVFPALDAARPATLSPRVLGDLLRGELGYGGVIVSDDLDMNAIADHAPPGDAAVAAVSAGCDVLLACRREDVQDAAYEALVRAAEASPAFARRLGEAAARARALKAARRELADAPLPPRDPEGFSALAEELAAAGGGA